MRVAVFDPGRNLGVLKAPLRDKTAIRRGEHGDPGVTLYTAKLRDTTDLGAFLRSADEPIREALSGVELALIEGLNTQGLNHAGIIKTVALTGHIAYLATCMGIDRKAINLKHAKIFLTDTGNARKPDMIAAAEFQLGLRPGEMTEHEADAYGMWLVESFGVPKSASQREQERATARRLAREQARAEKAAADAAKKLPLF